MEEAWPGNCLLLGVLRDPALAQGRGPQMGSYRLQAGAALGQRPLGLLQGFLPPAAWVPDLLGVKAALPPGLGAYACFALGLQRRVGEEGGDG